MLDKQPGGLKMNSWAVFLIWIMPVCLALAIIDGHWVPLKPTNSMEEMMKRVISGQEPNRFVNLAKLFLVVWAVVGVVGAIYVIFLANGSGHSSIEPYL